MPAFIPTPDDFAQQAHRLTRELAKHYNVHPATIRNFRDRLGLPQITTQPVPSDIALVAPTMSFKKLADHYQVGHVTMRRWLATVGIVKARKSVVMPANFVEIAPTMTLREMMALADASRESLRKWEKATGVQCKREPGGQKPRGGRKPRPPRPRKERAVREKPADFQRAAAPTRTSFKPKGATIRTAGPQRDMTRAGQAADHLRRLDPVRRCDAAGDYALTGDHWHFRGRVYDAAGIIERAERTGFDPDAWQRVNEGPLPFGQIAAGIVASVQVIA